MKGRYKGRGRAAVWLGGYLALRARSWMTLAVVWCTAAGTLSLVAALSMPQIIGERDARAQARSPYTSLDEQGPPGPRTVRWEQRDGAWDGKPVTTFLVEVPKNPRTPPPPGLDAWPAPGESVVSPALHGELADGEQADVRARYGDIRGAFGEEGLLHPDERVAYVSVAQGELPDNSAIYAFGAPPNTDEYQPLGESPELAEAVRTLLSVAAVAVSVPLAMLVVGSSALLRERRRRTLGALELLGATPRAVRLITAAEVTVVAVAGWVLGVVATPWLLRAIAGLLPAPAAWFAGDVSLRLGPSLAAMAFFVAVAVLTAIRGRGGMSEGRGRSGRMRALPRLLPTVAAVGTLAVLAGWPWQPGSSPRGWVVFLGMGALSVAVIGLAWAGPLIVAACGRRLARSGRPAVALGGSRLAADPRTGTLGALAITLAVTASGVVGAITGQIAYLDTELYRTDPKLTATVVETDRLPQVRAALPEGAAYTEVTVSGIWNGSGKRLSSDPLEGPDPLVAVGDCVPLLERLVPERASEARKLCAGGVVRLEGQFATELPAKGSFALKPDPAYDEAEPRPHDDDPRFALPESGSHAVAYPEQRGVAREVVIPDLLVDAAAWSRAGGEVPTAGTLLAPGHDADATGVRTRVLDADRTAKVRDTASAYQERLDRTGQYRGWFGIAALVTLGVAAAFVVVSALTALLERRRSHAYLGIVGVPPGVLGRAWTLYAVLPVLVLLPVGWLLTVLADVGFDRVVRVPVQMTAAPYVSGLAIAVGLVLLLRLVAGVATPREVPLDALRTRE